MLTTYRRHRKHCPHRKNGRKYRRCHCPIWVDGFLAGRELRRSLALQDWEKAQTLIRKWETDKQADTKSEEHDAPISLSQAWQGFLSDMEARNLSVSTIRKYKLLSRRMQDFGTRRGLRFLIQFDVVTLRAFREEWKDGPLSSAKKLERLRAFFRFAQESKWVVANPASRLKTPKLTQRPTLPFTNEEMLRILSALDLFHDQTVPRGKNSARRLRALVLLLRYSGMRIGDAVKLTSDKINGEKLFLYTQKSGVAVYTVLPDFVIRALDVAPLVTATHFFWNGTDTLDGVVGSWQRRLRELFRLAKVTDGHAHRFRDTFAAELLLAAVPIERVAVLLGHQSVKVTEKYYSAWTASRQRQVEADLRRAWECDPVVLLDAKGTPQVHGKTETVN